MTDINNASSAYLNTLKSLQNGGGKDAVEEVAPAGGPSFADMMKAGLDSAIDAQKTSESVSAQALIGQADMTDVLQAANNAEVALNTVLAIRDRLVQAYETIMRTPI